MVKRHRIEQLFYDLDYIQPAVNNWREVIAISGYVGREMQFRHLKFEHSKIHSYFLNNYTLAYNQDNPCDLDVFCNNLKYPTQIGHF